MATDLEQMVLSISADTRQAVNALKRFGVDVANVANDTEKAFTRPRQQIDRLSESLGKSKFETANLAAQFQDIAVQLQGGASPFTVALQQGTQISQILGSSGKGLGGVVTALGGAFASIVSPVSLATIALIALGAAGINYLTQMFGDTEDLNDQLKAHKDIISSIKDAYGDALDGVELYAKESTAVLEAQARASAAAIGETLKSEVQSVLKQSGSLFIDPNDIIGDKETFAVKQRFQVFSDAILALRQSAAAGEPDIRAFRVAVADIANADPSNKKLQDLAKALLEMSSDAAKASDALAATERAIAATASVASGSLQAIKEYRDALTDLSKVALPNMSPRQQADAAYARAISSASTPGARAAADTEYLAALARIDAAEKELEDKRAQRDAESAARRAARKGERDQERIDSVIKGLQTEADNIGRVAREQAVYNAVAAAGVDINSRYGQQIAGLAGHLYDLQEAQAAAVEAMDTLRAGASDVLSGFVSDIRNGVSATEALGNALGRIADRLADIAIQSAIDGIFGKSGGTGGGLIGSFVGSLLGRAGGGAVQAGQPYRVGEQGPEVFVPTASGRIVPNSALGRSGNITFAPSTTIDARGSSITEAQIAQVVKENNRQLLAQVPGVVDQAWRRMPRGMRP
jgi:hypothetical protein